MLSIDLKALLGGKQRIVVNTAYAPLRGVAAIETLLNASPAIYAFNCLTEAIAFCATAIKGLI